MATDTGYSRRDALRVCDICGHRFHKSSLKPIGELKWACPDDYQGLTALQISRYNANVKPIVVKPVRNAKPDSYIDIYQLPEGQLLNFILRTAPYESFDVTSGGGAITSSQIPSTAPASAPSWAAIYLADIVLENKRPRLWISAAKTAVATCCDFLLLKQEGSPQGTSPFMSISDSRYGGFLSTEYQTSDVIAAGIAFVKGYQVLGTIDYLLAADRCATFLRHVQCGDKESINPVSQHVGGFGKFIKADHSTEVVDHAYLIADIAGAWFLNLLSGIRGSSAVYGDVSATAFFLVPTAASLSTMISEALSFAESGALEGSALVVGVSASTPRHLYNATTHKWEMSNGSIPGGTQIDGEALALALRGIYECHGFTAQVSSVLSWLDSFTSNTANQTTGQSEAQIVAGIKGTYDPSYTVADHLEVLSSDGLTSKSQEATGAEYSWSSAGVLAPLRVAQGKQPKKGKDALSKPRRRVWNSPESEYLSLFGKSGLSFQPFSASGARVRSVTGAAKTGGIYRVAPGRFPALRG